MSKNVIGDLEQGDMFIYNGNLATYEYFSGVGYIRFCFSANAIPATTKLSPIQYIGVAKDFEHKLLTKIKKYDTI